MFVLYALLGMVGGLPYAQIPRRPIASDGSGTSALGPPRGIVFKLAALFSLDAFAGGFAVQSLLALWLFERFDLSLSAAGLLFFWAGVLSAFSFPVAAWLSRHIGLINTNGLYAHPIQHRADAGGLCADAAACPGAPADPGRSVADGRANALLPRDGGRHGGGASRGGELHVRPAQPRRGNESGAGGGTVRPPHTGHGLSSSAVRSRSPTT
jgi:hypothetical protein